MRACRPQVPDVAGVKQVEDAVGEYDAAAGGAGLADEVFEAGGVQDPPGSTRITRTRHPGVFLNRTSPVKRQAWRGR